MLMIKGKIMFVEQVTPQPREPGKPAAKPYQQLTLLGQNGKGPELVKVKDMTFGKFEVGKDVTLPISARSYYFNGRHGLTFTHFGS